MNGLSPECVLRWVLRLSDVENDFEHILQTNGISPECVLGCLSRLPESENDLKHSLQANGFSPVFLAITSPFRNWQGRW